MQLLTLSPPIQISQRPRSFSTGTSYNQFGDTATTNNSSNNMLAKSAMADEKRYGAAGGLLQPTKQQHSGNPNRYKTELCRPFQEYGHCRYGDKCQFAHGKEDMRNPMRHPKYKTEFCRTFHSQGYCPYGARCHFVHSTGEVRPLLPLSGRAPLPPVSSSSGYMSFTKPPLSPSQDSGISSPEGTPSCLKVFEYPSSECGSSADDQDSLEYHHTDSFLWKRTGELQFTSDWADTSSLTDSFSPVKAPPVTMEMLDDITEQFSTTSLDGAPYRPPSRLPIFNQLESISDTALLFPPSPSTSTNW